MRDIATAACAAGADVSTFRNRVARSFAKATATTSRIVHANFPHYGNIGDSAIWLAEETMIDANGCPRRASLCTTEATERFFQLNGMDDTTVVLPGGGNFGCLWPREHERRLWLMERFSGASFVQMPQSIHFSDSLLLRRTQDALRKISCFTLLVRDRASFEFANRNLECETYLVPDSAFFLCPIAASTAGSGILRIIRGDKEGSATSLHNALDRKWTQDPKSLRRRARFAHWAGLALPGNDLETMLYRGVARTRLARGIDLLCSAQGIITDRLHAHILCVLLGIPHVAVDTIQGKIRHFHETWTSSIPYCRIAEDYESAEAILIDLLKNCG